MTMFLHVSYVVLLNLIWLDCEAILLTTTEEKLIEIFRIQKEMSDVINEFVLNEGKRIDHLKRLLRAFNNTDDSRFMFAEERIETNIEHPINSFHLIKKLVHEWNGIRDIMKRTPYEDIKEKLTKIENEYLNLLRGNWNATISVIKKIQETYSFSTNDIVDGLWGKTKLNVILSSRECFHIGIYFLNHMNYALAMQWLEASINKYQNSTEYSTDDFLESSLCAFAKSAFMNQNINASLKYLELFKDVDESDKCSYQFEDHIRLVTNRTTNYLSPRIDENQNKCAELCKMSLESETRSSYLKCRFNNKNSAFVRLAPLKEELIYEDPSISIFRNVLSDNEIEFLKHLSSEKLKVSEVSTEKGNGQNFDVHVSEVVYLSSNDHPQLAPIKNRIEDIISLKTKYAEPIQVVCYANGDYYVVHSDYLLETNESVVNRGNRITTVLFYLNDVKLGGATGFCNLGIAVKPAKGSALVWSNITPRGDCDKKTLHCACPVLIGHK